MNTVTTVEIALRLIDFSPLKDYLAQFYVHSAKGQVPFQPVSLFVCLCLRRKLNCSWRYLARLLAGEHGSGWRRVFGFLQSVTPSASGTHYFFSRVGPQVFDELCPLFITVCHGLMLHEGRCNMGCPQVAETCDQPAPRPCPANADERNLFPEGVAQPQIRFPWLKIGEVLTDGALGTSAASTPSGKHGPSA